MNNHNKCLNLFLIFVPSLHQLASEEEWRRLMAAAANDSRLLTPVPGLTQQIRPTAASLGPPLILQQRMTVPTPAPSILSGQTASENAFANAAAHGMIFAPYGEYANYATLAGNPLLTEYADHTGGLFAR